MKEPKFKPGDIVKPICKCCLTEPNMIVVSKHIYGDNSYVLNELDGSLANGTWEEKDLELVVIVEGFEV